MATPLPLRARDLRARLDAGEPLQLVDVREDAELALARLPHPVLHLPLSRFQDWSVQLPQQLDPSRPVVVMCHAGVRSWQFSCWLLQHWAPAVAGDVEIWDLEGGIEAWSLQVDPTVPRY